MKKTLRIMLALTLVIAALTVSVSATATNGFYDIGSANNVTIAPYAGNTAVTATNADVDADDADEVYYENSDRLDVTYSAAANGANYGVILVEGSSLPTASSDIYFIDQVKAEGESINFNVYPSDIAATKTAMTMYISSSVADAGLVTVPMAYVVGYEEVVTPPTPEEPEILYGDVNANGEVELTDLTRLKKFMAEYDVDIDEAASDVNVNGEVELTDLTRLAKFFAEYDVVLGPSVS